MSTSNTAGQKIFLLTPLRKGRPILSVYLVIDFRTFLLTPLREGRRSPTYTRFGNSSHFYSRPCGRGDPAGKAEYVGQVFLLTPLRERRRSCSRCCSSTDSHFYSRPCGRGDVARSSVAAMSFPFLLTPLREGRRASASTPRTPEMISTHAPAGGATQAAAS